MLFRRPRRHDGTAMRRARCRSSYTRYESRDRERRRTIEMVFAERHAFIAHAGGEMLCCLPPARVTITYFSPAPDVIFATPSMPACWNFSA